MSLTDVAIRKAKPKAKPYKLSDERGLYLEVAPRGGKWWRMKYRFAGKEKRLSLGVYPDVGLKDARERCDEARKLLAAGADPGETRKAAKAARNAEVTNSFEIVAREWHNRQAETWVPSHRACILRRLEANVFPWIGSRPVGEVSAPELLAVLRRVEERGAVETAHRISSICGQVFRYAISTGRAQRNPSADLRGALPSVKTKHFAATTNPKRLGEILRAMEGYEGTLVVRCALRFAPLVFVRPGELRQARWADIDLTAAEWGYHVTKTNTQHVVPLCRQAIQILKEVHPLTGRGLYVFPCARGGNRPMSNNAILAAMRRMGIEPDEMSGHGFRAVARTILDEGLGFRPDYIEHQLAHTVRDPLGRAYNRTAHLEERRKMMQAWGDHLDKLRLGG